MLKCCHPKSERYPTTNGITAGLKDLILTTTKKTSKKAKPVAAVALVSPRVETPVGFGMVVANKNLALAHLRIADAALAFIGRGLRDFTGMTAAVSLEAFSPTVRCRFLQALTDNGFLDLPQSLDAQKDTWNDSLVKAMHSFHLAYRDTSKYLFDGVAPPWMGACLEKDERASALSTLKKAPLDQPEHADPLEQAYRMSRYNRIRCEQRVTLLHLLSAVSLRVEFPGPAQAEQNAACAHLLRNRTLHLSRQFGLSALLGGAALEETRATMKHMYREGVSIVEMLEVDGVHPGYYRTEDEQKFRAALDNA